MRYFKKLSGERVYLSPMHPDDAEQYAKWLNDAAVAGYLGMHRQLISIPGESKMIEKMISEGHNFAMVLHDCDRLIGNISLMQVDPVNRRATAGLFIGEADDRSKGYGAEALRLILDYGFNWLNLHNIDLTVHSDNARGIACYEKVGFRAYGRRAEACFKDGRYVDEVRMEMLDREFNEKYRK